MSEQESFVRCERCGGSGGRVAYGWTLLCKSCINDDMKEWE